jgi:hypothetical protein
MLSTVKIDGDGGMFIRCEVYDDTSLRGETVDVFIPADMVDQLLLACRDKARENRRRSGPSNDARSPLLDEPAPMFSTTDRDATERDAERVAADFMRRDGAPVFDFTKVDEAARTEGGHPAADDIVRRWANRPRDD